jgi:hypothetical protein
LYVTLCRSGSWLPGFAIVPDFVVPIFDLPEVGSSRSSWLTETLDELEVALDQYNNSCSSLYGLRFSLFKELPMEAKLYLLDIYNDFLATGVVPIVKPGKDPFLSGLYRPISLLADGRKLIEKMICTRLDFWAEKHGILSPTKYGFKKGKGTRCGHLIFQRRLR